VFVGEASYCLYLLHFSLWNLIHDSHVLNRLNLSQYDPWISYGILIGLALLALHLVEKPAQKLLRQWMDATPRVKELKLELASADKDGP
jgi:peptidoglycan/LPS O-acetylase OafA/YrhL